METRGECRGLFIRKEYCTERDARPPRTMSAVVGHTRSRRLHTRRLHDIGINKPQLASQSGVVAPNRPWEYLHCTCNVPQRALREAFARDRFQMSQGTKARARIDLRARTLV